MTTYREYYAACRTAYAGAGVPAMGVYQLSVHTHIPGRATDADVLTLDHDYEAVVRELAAEVDRRVRNGVAIYRENDRQVQELAIKLDGFWDIAALETLGAILVPQVEERVLGCHALVNQVNLIRSLPDAVTRASSWLWHYDNCPNEAFKILIYLTHVNADTGAFEYLRNVTTDDVVKVGSSRSAPGQVAAPRWPGSRVPLEVIEQHRDNGYEPRRVVGPPGTLILFDNNCIHRATVPVARHRDAVILNFRPSHERVRPFISERYTGSWSYNAKQWIPEVLEASAVLSH